MFVSLTAQEMVFLLCRCPNCPRAVVTQSSLHGVIWCLLRLMMVALSLLRSETFIRRTLHTWTMYIWNIMISGFRRIATFFHCVGPGYQWGCHALWGSLHLTLQWWHAIPRAWLWELDGRYPLRKLTSIVSVGRFLFNCFLFLIMIDRGIAFLLSKTCLTKCLDAWDCHLFSCQYLLDLSETKL